MTPLVEDQVIKLDGPKARLSHHPILSYPLLFLRMSVLHESLVVVMVVLTEEVVLKIQYTQYSTPQVSITAKARAPRSLPDANDAKPQSGTS